jgi:hypothetical protein
VSPEHGARELGPQILVAAPYLSCEQVSRYSRMENTKARNLLSLRWIGVRENQSQEEKNTFIDFINIKIVIGQFLERK